MAILRSDDWSFDFQYTGFKYGWVQYQFYFRWKGESVIRDDVLEHNNDEHWGTRPAGSLVANESDEDTFSTFLRKVLETDKAGWWEPTEPDIQVAIHPGFLRMSTLLEPWPDSEEFRTEREAREAQKRERGRQPDDGFIVIFLVGAYNFKGADAYYGGGLALHMSVERQALEQFAADLEAEYAAFKQKFKVDEHPKWL